MLERSSADVSKSYDSMIGRVPYDALMICHLSSEELNNRVLLSATNFGDFLVGFIVLDGLILCVILIKDASNFFLFSDRDLSCKFCDERA